MIPFLQLLLLLVLNQSSSSPYADVVGVKASGEEKRYTFLVGIKSPDKGCKQYADWWEVVSPEGQLIFRRILMHSHVGEQPFYRSGNPIRIDAEQPVWIRAHMNNTGFGGKAYYGSVKEGFMEKEIPEDFALELANEKPLPKDCWH